MAWRVGRLARGRRGHARCGRPCSRHEHPVRAGEGKRCRVREPLRHAVRVARRRDRALDRLRRPGESSGSRRSVGVAMSQGNLTAIRSMYAGFSDLAAGGDIASYVRSHYDPEIEYLPVEESAVIRGHDDLIRWNERWLDAWTDFDAEVNELQEEGDVVVASVTVAGLGE